MAFLGLAVACSLVIAMIFKHAERAGLHVLPLLAVNYAVATATAAFRLAQGSEDFASLAIDPLLVALGVFTGSLYIASFAMFSEAIRAAGMSLAAGVMRLSVVIPFMASWLVWNEVPGSLQLAGIGLAGAAFFLVAHRNDPVSAANVGAAIRTAGGRPGVLLVLSLLFVIGGMTDVCMKAFDVTFAAPAARPFFLLLVFGVAFTIGATLVLRRALRTGRWPSAGELAWGMGLGLVNYGSAEFFLHAIERLPGTFVFPVNNIAIVIGATLIGVVFWKERLTGRNMAGLALAGVALVLLGL
jgi:drug/metabolite transporter (DMT)-like permease